MGSAPLHISTISSEILIDKKSGNQPVDSKFFLKRRDTILHQPSAGSKREKLVNVTYLQKTKYIYHQ